ncbi:MAG: type II secretion system protein [Gammaproteobacteria bacterium]
MNTEQRPGLKGGFSLVELLIVVIILAILAAIVVPQFSDTTDDARASAIESNIASMRSAIQVYRQQHGAFPSAVAATGATCPAGVAGTGALNSAQAFAEQLTQYTTPAGGACTGTDGTLLGPYLNEVPVNPANNLATVEVLTTGVLGLTSDGGHGWKFDNVTGELIADN